MEIHEFIAIIVAGIAFILFGIVVWISCRHYNAINKLNSTLSSLGSTERIAIDVRDINLSVRIIAYIALAFCLGVVIHYLAIALPRIYEAKENAEKLQNFGVDYLGLIVAIFAILVTLLVGWQIFNNIKEKERLVQISSDNKEFTKTVKGELAKFGKTLESIQEQIICVNADNEEIKEQVEKTINQYESIKLLSESFRDATIGDLFRGLKMINYTEAYTNTFNAITELIDSILTIETNSNGIAKEYAVWEYIDSLDSDLTNMIKICSTSFNTPEVQEIAKWSVYWNNLYTSYENDILEKITPTRHTEKFISCIKNIRDKRLELVSVCNKIQIS